MQCRFKWLSFVPIRSDETGVTVAFIGCDGDAAPSNAAAAGKLAEIVTSCIVQFRSQTARGRHRAEDVDRTQSCAYCVPIERCERSSSTDLATLQYCSLLYGQTVAETSEYRTCQFWRNLVGLFRTINFARNYTLASAADAALNSRTSESAANLP
jgi:hypothetical protein